MPRITMYSTAWCADCRNAKRFFNEAGIVFDEIDIDQNDAAARQVIDWSGGRRVIPTIHIQPCEGGEPIIAHNPRMPELVRIAALVKGN